MTEAGRTQIGGYSPIFHDQPEGLLLSGHAICLVINPLLETRRHTYQQVLNEQVTPFPCFTEDASVENTWQIIEFMSPVNDMFREKEEFRHNLLLSDTFKPSFFLELALFLGEFRHI